MLTSLPAACDQLSINSSARTELHQRYDDTNLDCSRHTLKIHCSRNTCLR